MAKKNLKKGLSILLALIMCIGLLNIAAFAADGNYPIDKTANGLDENDQTDVTLTVPGISEGNIDVVILLGGGMQANRETVESAINLFKPLMESGKSTVRLGLISLEKGEEIILDLNSDEAILHPDTYEQLIEDRFAYIDGLPVGTTNLHSQLLEAQKMLAKETTADADNKYIFVIATGRTYWFDNANGDQATIVNKVNDTYYWGHYLWQSQRGRHTSLYMIPDRYNDSYEAFFADIEKWVAADGDKYVYSPLFDKKDNTAYETWYANNGKDLSALGIASSRFGNGIVNPVPTAENFITGTPAAIGSGNHPENALNYERAQYECVLVWNELIASGYNCYSICSESPNYQNGSEYIVQGAGYTGTSTIQVGHSFMNYLATLAGQTEAPTVWDYTRDADGNIISTATVLQENFFEPIAEDILYNCSIGSTVVDYIGKNENGNFEFIEEADCITLNVGGKDYITTKTSDTEEGSSYAFAASVDAEPTFWLDYTYGDGKTTEKFIWTFGENVSMANVAKLTYKLQLTEKQTAEGTYTVPTNNSATLYPVDSDGKLGTPEVFPVPEVTYDVVIPNEEPPVTPPTVTFKSGEVSNISFVLIDPATGELEFLYKVDVGSETSFEIPAEEGKISAVFLKQGSKEGMFWFSEEVSDDIVAAVIKLVDDNNPSYKGYSTTAFGEGDHSYTFKKKTITYTFTGGTAVLEEEEIPSAPVEEPTEEPAEEPEAKDEPVVEESNDKQSEKEQKKADKEQEKEEKKKKN